MEDDCREPGPRAKIPTMLAGIVKEETGSTSEAYKAPARKALPANPGLAESTRMLHSDPRRGGAEMQAARGHLVGGANVWHAPYPPWARLPLPLPLPAPPTVLFARFFCSLVLR